MTEKREYNPTEIALQHVVCHYCDAKVGQWCRTVSGHYSQYLHQSRLEPINEAFGYGYQEGFDGAKHYYQIQTPERIGT